MLKKQGFILGIDAGGTRTRAVITDESGSVLGLGYSGGANQHIVPLDEGFGHIKNAVEQAKVEVQKNNASLRVEKFEAACLGLAGYDSDDDRKMIREYLGNLALSERTLGAKILTVVNDGLIGFKSGTDNSYGICMISGTGSNCYGVAISGREARAGDWGYILGDQGSGFVIGQKILHQVMREYDGREKETALTVKVLKHLTLKSPLDLIKWVYASPLPVKEIASLAKLMSDPELADLSILSELLDQSVEELMMAYKAVFRRLEFGFKDKIPVVLVGGLFEVRDRLAGVVVKAIKERTPNAEIVFSKQQSVQGAVKVAQMALMKQTLSDSALIMMDSD